MKGWWFQMAWLLRGYPSGDSGFLCDGSIPSVHYRTVVKTSGSTPAHQSIPPPPLPSPSVCLSLAHSLSFCASSSRSGGSGARVAVATCPIPIAGWIIPGLCYPATSSSPQCTHKTDTHAPASSPLPSTRQYSFWCFFPSFVFSSSHFLSIWRSMFPWVSQIRELTVCLAAESEEISLYIYVYVYRVSHASVGFPIMSATLARQWLARIGFSREELQTLHVDSMHAQADTYKDTAAHVDKNCCAQIRVLDISKRESCIRGRNDHVGSVKPPKKQQ